MPAVRIPRYQQQIGAPSISTPTVRGVATPEDPTGAAMMQLGATGLQISERMRREQEIEDEKRKRLKEKQELEDAKLEAHSVLSDARLAWTEQMLAAKEKAAPGAAGFTPEVLKQFDDYSTKAIGDRPNAITKRLLQEGFQNLRTSLGQDALVFEAQARVDNRVNSVEAGLNKAAQAVLTDPRQRAIALNEQLAYINSIDIPPKAKEALKERALQSLDSAALNGEINRSRNNIRAMDGLLDRMGKGEFAGVPAQQLAAAETRIGNFKNSLIVRSEAAERRRLTGLEQQAKRLSWYVENGRDIPPNEIDTFTRNAKGTAYEGALMPILDEQKAVSEIAKLAPDQQVAKVKEMQASYGETPSKEQLTKLTKIQRYVNNNLKLLNESPLDYAAQREGAQVTPLDLQKPDTWASTLGARTAILTDQARRNGVAPKGLLPQEAQQISNALKAARPEQARDMLTKLYAGFGDDKVYRATMQQLAPDNPVMAVAGIAAARGLESSADRSVADYILRGQQLLRQDTKEDGKPSGGKLIPMPKETEMASGFASLEGNAFAGREQARNAYYQAAKSIYAAKSAEEGDYSGEIKSERWDTAMNLATGGIDTYKGRSIVLPYGVKVGEFKDGLKQRIPALIAAGRLTDGWTPEKLRDLPLENAGDGRYFFRVGDGVLVGKDGRPVVLDWAQR
jgi:hypothetical protein